jgi:hypothetical protein
MLLKQHLIGVSGDPFAFRGYLPIAADTSFSSEGLLISVLGLCS